MSLTYLIGDATYPTVSPAIIAHIVNDSGFWGKGFVMALSRRSETPREMYRKWHEKYVSYLPLGSVQITPFVEDFHVANMVAQHGISSSKGIPPIRYEALEKCLTTVNRYAENNKMSVVMPMIGCGLAGGSWKKVEDIIKKTFSVPVYVYMLRCTD